MYTTAPTPINFSRPRHASSPSILMFTPYQQRPCECRYCISHPASTSPQQPSSSSSSSTSSYSSTSITTFYQPSYTTRQPPLSPVSNYTLLPTPPPRRGGALPSSPPVSPRTVPRYTFRGPEGGNTAGRRGTFGQDALEAQIRGQDAWEGQDGGRGRGKKRSSAEMEQQHREGQDEREDREEWEKLEREYIKRVRGWATAVIPVGGE
ncbi:hypothetical protein GE09DRAFT_685663 [Coniochaeta sp. 2T2.1]|nr:hypothetical protein GE09DRAFT_685663 [Coniochaeta sp. 2T2.1]